MNQPNSPKAIVTLQALRTRWESVAETFPRELRKEKICTRMYRAFSWLERAEDLDAREGPSSANDQLVFTWTALNSLYGRWNEQSKEPERDLESLSRFTDILFEIDRETRIPLLLMERRSKVEAVLDNQFLTKQFWNAPDLRNA